MGKIRLLSVLILVFVCASLLSVAPALASPEPVNPPPGFYGVTSTTGVSLFQKDYPNGNPDFVQVIDLSLGASVHLLHAPIADPGTGQGVYGGDNPKFKRQSLANYWNEISASNTDAFCVNTGQFFYMPEYPSGLAFPIKKDGQLLTDGYGINEYPGKKIMLELWNDRADIIELTPENLSNSTAPNIIAGLTEEANKRGKFSVGRTFTGIDDRNGDGQFETILILTTLTAKQVDAANTLREFGADKVMMLDGGGSAQLLCQGKTYVRSDRLIPQALATVAGRIPTWSALFVTQSGWYEIVEGEEVQVVVEAQNTGTETWKSDEVHLLVDFLPVNTMVDVPIQAETPPGGIGTFTWLMPPLSAENVYTGTMRLARGGDLIPVEPLAFHTAVLPGSLAEQEPEFEALMGSWVATPEAEVGSLALGWMEENEVITPIQALKENVQEVRKEVQKSLVAPVVKTLVSGKLIVVATDVFIIPAIILPLTTIVLVTIFRQRKRYPIPDVEYETDYELS